MRKPDKAGLDIIARCVNIRSLVLLHQVQADFAMLKLLLSGMPDFCGLADFCVIPVIPPDLRTFFVCQYRVVRSQEFSDTFSTRKLNKNGAWKDVLCCSKNGNRGLPHLT